MTSQTIYAYTDIHRNTVMVGETDLNFTGTWSSSGTYWADPKDTVQYGNTQYIAVVDNENVVPTFVPKKGQRKWSELTVIRAGTHFDEHTIDEAYELAEQAMEVAVQGTNAAASANSLAQAALLTAWTGTSAAAAANDLALTALQTAWSGTAAAAQAQTTADNATSIAVAGTNAAAAAQVSANVAQATANNALQVAWAGTAASEANAHERVGFSFVISDGQGAEVVQGFKGYVEIPFAMRLDQWTIVADQSGSCVVDITKSNGYAGFPTTASITDNDKPTLDNAQKNQNTNPTAWNRDLGQGDLVGFTVLGAGTVQSVTVALSGTRS